jgi:hypothetical protein
VLPGSCFKWSYTAVGLSVDKQVNESNSNSFAIFNDFLVAVGSKVPSWTGALMMSGDIGNIATPQTAQDNPSITNLRAWIFSPTRPADLLSIDMAITDAPTGNIISFLSLPESATPALIGVGLLILLLYRLTTRYAS